jgi:hypothetical protein
MTSRSGKRTSISLPSNALPDTAHLLPEFLKECSDAVGETLLASAANQSLKGEELLRPTFTFKVDAKHPRKYKDKRTPSWTDRILAKGYGRLLGPAKGGSASILHCRSLPHVVCSDHEPVMAIIGIGHHDLTKFALEMTKKHEHFRKQTVKELEFESDTDHELKDTANRDLANSTGDCWGGADDGGLCAACTIM